MPLFKHLHIGDDYDLYIWRMDEAMEWFLEKVKLSQSEQKSLNGYKSESRRKEFLATRLLVQKFVAPDLQITHNEHGKPYFLHSDLSISISHSKNYAAILVSKHSAALDMEYLSDRVERISKRFLSESELRNISEQDRTLHLYQHWCAKECLIKLYGKKDVHLINELRIPPFSPMQKTFNGAVCRSDFSAQFDFSYLIFDGYLLVYSIQKDQ